MPVTDLLSLDDAKAHLNMASAVNDAELVDVIDEASEIIEDLTGPIRPKSFTQTFRNPRGGTLLLSQAPVLSVDTVTMTTQGTLTGSWTSVDLALNPATGEVSFPDGTAWNAPTLISLEGRGRLNDRWFRPTVVVTVTYTAGRASVPVCVRRAMKELVRHIWETQRGDSPGRPTPGYDTEQFTTTPSGFLVPNRVAEAVAPVRRTAQVA